MKKLMMITALTLTACGTQKPESVVDQRCQTSIDALNALTSKDDCDAEHKLGLMYFTGTCFEQNNNKALSYFYKAANKGQPKAQIILGNLFYQKPNDPMISRCPDCQIKPDLAEALKWYTLAQKNRLTSDEASLLKRLSSNIQKDISPALKGEADKRVLGFKYTPFRCSPRAKF